jgi:transposase
VSKTYRPWEPGQSLLFPPSPLDWLPEGHLARFVLDVVDELELGPIMTHYERELRGYPPHHPKMMVALLLYAYSVGVPSSRKIEKRCHEDIAFRVITGNTQPDHSCISEFRRIHLVALAGLFLQILKLCQAAGLVKLGHVALDGTKLKANASKHKAMSYAYMKKRDDELSEQIAKLLQAAEQADGEEDARCGKGRRGDELPTELQRAETRRARIRELKAELEAEAKAQKEAAEAAAASARDDNRDDDHRDPPGPTPLPTHKVPTTADGTPTDKAQRNFTDGDSRIMKTGDGFVQGYNCQSVVDEAHQIIVAQEVTNQPPDVEHLLPMLEQTIANCGAVPDEMTADAGFLSEANIIGAIERGVDPHIATGRRKHGVPAPIVRGRTPNNLTLTELMTRKLATRAGAAIYARRKAVAEPPFGQIKNRGFRQFLLRGIAKVRGEWSLITMSHNLLKLFSASVA